MGIDYEELDYQPTSMGELLLRRRRLPQIPGRDVFEVKLGESFLMSSLFHEAEWQLAKLGLAAVDGQALDVVVGGLGLGYTAAAALEDPRVRSLAVVEFLEPVIDWHRRGLVPLGATLCADARCRFVSADFFALSRDVARSFDPAEPDKLHDAILLDIDHTPTNVLRQTNRRFYTEDGLRELAMHLRPGGVFALWADGRPEDAFVDLLARVFASAAGREIAFANPIAGGESRGAVYVARTAG